MKKIILTLGVVLALVAVLVVPMAALADNTGTQSATTSKATSITIKAQGLYHRRINYNVSSRFTWGCHFQPD